MCVSLVENMFAHARLVRRLQRTDPVLHLTAKGSVNQSLLVAASSVAPISLVSDEIEIRMIQRIGTSTSPPFSQRLGLVSAGQKVQDHTSHL